MMATCTYHPCCATFSAGARCPIFGGTHEACTYQIHGGAADAMPDAAETKTATGGSGPELRSSK